MPVFLSLGSAEPQGSANGCQGFREQMNMCNGGKVLLAVLNFYIWIKIRVATFDTHHSVTESTQSINRCFNPEASWFCSQVSQYSSPWTVSICLAKRSGYRKSEVSRWLFTCNVYKGLINSGTWLIADRYGFINKFCSFFKVPWAKIDREAWF